MLLRSRGDFSYSEDQTSSSDAPGAPPPAGDGGSGRGYRNILGFGFGGGRSSGSGSDNRGSHRNNNERHNDNPKIPTIRWRNEPSHLDTKSPSQHLSRDDLRDVALSTLQIIDEGEYFPPGVDGPYELRTKIKWTEENTRYYAPEAGEGGMMLESEFIKINKEHENGGNDDREGDREIGTGEEEEEEENRNASSLDGGLEGNEAKATTTASKAENEQIDDNKVQAQAPIPPDPKNSARSDTLVCVGEYSTLVGARRLHLALSSNLDPPANKRIGVLNFASAKKPGGGFINGSQAQEESIARASTLYPSLMTTAASRFYSHHHEDPNNAYYTHAMVYSPGVILLRDDNGEWRSPVEVDVLTSAAVNAGEIRRGLERKERLRRQREEEEYWRRKGEERRKEFEKIMAEKERLKKKKEMLMREKEKLRKEKAQAAKLKKEKTESTKLQKRIVKSHGGNETEKKEEGREEDSSSEKEDTSVEQEKADAEGKEEKEKEKSADAEAEKSEENQEEKVTDSPDSGSSSDSEVKKAEGGNTRENAESKGVSTQDDQLQPEVPTEVNRESSSSTAMSHSLSPESQPSQAPKPDSDLPYAVALSNAESEIYHTMYTRISRILHLFQLHQAKHLILGSFGTGVFQNHIDLVATIFADLLVRPGGRFKNVFNTVVFAILGKETAKIFGHVFSRVEKRAQRERGIKGETCVFLDEEGGDGDVREGEEERMMRMMRWEARRNTLADAAALADEAAYAAQARIEAASLAAYSNSLTAYAASEPAYAAFDINYAASQAGYAAQAEINAAYFAASQANALHAGAASRRQSDDTAAHDDKIAEDEKMIVTGDDEKVDGTTTTSTTPKATILDDGKDVEMAEIGSLSFSHGDVEMR